MRRVLLLALMVFTLSAVFGGVSASAATQHCPSGGTKTEVSDSFGSTITLPAGTQFCVKAGTKASGILVSDGSPYMTEADLGQRLSGGCQRQSNRDAQFMWAFADIGTKVVVM